MWKKQTVCCGTIGDLDFFLLLFFLNFLFYKMTIYYLSNTHNTNTVSYPVQIALCNGQYFGEQGKCPLAVLGALSLAWGKLTHPWNPTSLLIAGMCTLFHILSGPVGPTQLLRPAFFFRTSLEYFNQQRFIALLILLILGARGSRHTGQWLLL